MATVSKAHERARPVRSTSGTPSLSPPPSTKRLRLTVTSNSISPIVRTPAVTPSLPLLERIQPKSQSRFKRSRWDSPLSNTETISITSTSKQSITRPQYRQEIPISNNRAIEGDKLRRQRGKERGFVKRMIVKGNFNLGSKSTEYNDQIVGGSIGEKWSRGKDQYEATPAEWVARSRTIRLAEQTLQNKMNLVETNQDQIQNAVKELEAEVIPRRILRTLFQLLIFGISAATPDDDIRNFFADSKEDFSIGLSFEKGIPKDKASRKVIFLLYARESDRSNAYIRYKGSKFPGSTIILQVFARKMEQAQDNWLMKDTFPGSIRAIETRQWPEFKLIIPQSRRKDEIELNLTENFREDRVIDLVTSNYGVKEVSPVRVIEKKSCDEELERNEFYEQEEGEIIEIPDQNWGYIKPLFFD